MLLNSAFEQQTGSGLVFFFFRFWGRSPAYGQKARKNRVRIRFMKTWYGKFMQQKYLVRTNYSMGPDPFFFFCGVNGTYETSLFCSIALGIAPIQTKARVSSLP